MSPGSGVDRPTSPHETARNIPRPNRRSQAGGAVPQAQSSVDPERIGHPDEIVTGGPSSNSDALPFNITPEEHAHIRDVEYRHADEINTLLSNGDVNSVRARLANGVDIDVRDRTGNTPLNRLCRQGKFDLIEWLLKNGASPNIHNDDGQTALTTAIYNDRPDVVRVLLRHNADLDIRDKIGMTPIDFAHGYGRSKIEKILSDHQEMKAAPRRSNDGPTPVAEWRNSPTDRYDPERKMYYYFRHHTNGPDTSHWVEDSSDEQVPLKKQKIVKRHSQDTTPALKRGRDYVRRYKSSEAIADSPHFKEAFRPRKLGLFGKYDLPNKSDRLWKRWVDLKPHKGWKVSDKDGYRFQRRPPAPSASERKPTVRFADSTPDESARLGTYVPIADSQKDALESALTSAKAHVQARNAPRGNASGSIYTPTYSQPAASVNQPIYQEPRVDGEEAKRLQEESDRKIALKFQGMEVTKRIQDGFSRKIALNLQRDQVYGEPSQPIASGVNGHNDIRINPVYRNLREDVRGDIERFNNRDIPIDQHTTPENIVGQLLTETEIRELHRIFQGPPAGDEFVRERFRDVVQREFLRIGPGDPREEPRQPAAALGVLRTGHLPGTLPWQATVAQALEENEVKYDRESDDESDVASVRGRKKKVLQPAAPAPKMEHDDDIFNFENDESPPAPPSIAESQDSDTEHYAPLGHPRAGDAYFVHHDRNGKDTTRWVKKNNPPLAAPAVAAAEDLHEAEVLLVRGHTQRETSCASGFFEGPNGEWRIDPRKGIASYNQVIARFGEENDPAMRERVATAQLFKGLEHCRLAIRKEGRIATFDYQGLKGRQLVHRDAAMTAYDQIIARCGEAPEPEVRELAAIARYCKAAITRRGAPEAYNSVVMGYCNLDASEIESLRRQAGIEHRQEHYGNG